MTGERRPSDVVKMIVKPAAHRQRKFVGAQADLIQKVLIACGDKNRIPTKGAQSAKQIVGRNLRAARCDRRVRMAEDRNPPAIGMYARLASIHEHGEQPR